METKTAEEHDTALEHALDVAKANLKQATKLLNDAKAGHAAGDVPAERVRQLEDLYNLAEEDLRRVMREQ